MPSRPPPLVPLAPFLGRPFPRVSSRPSMAALSPSRPCMAALFPRPRRAPPWPPLPPCFVAAIDGHPVPVAAVYGRTLPPSPPVSGIYIHIPFCASRCIYCDFYSTTLRNKAPQYVEALIREMDERRSFLHTPVRTIYFGGGTPSQLGPSHIATLLRALSSRFDLSLCEEITLEANPEDFIDGTWPLPSPSQPSMAASSSLFAPPVSVAAKFGCQASPSQPSMAAPSSPYAGGLEGGLITRLSLGVQSLVDSELRLLHRRHNAAHVREAVHLIRNAGITNLSLDLMYGLPTQTLASWEYSIDEVLKLRPQHISAYNLSVEPGTRLHTLVQNGELTPCDDETCLQMAALLRTKLNAAGFEQYEISNFSLPGFHSRHNSSYWEPTPYLGLGPGAHSYDGHNRRSWNAPDISSYLKGIRHEEFETLSDLDLYNERVMLGLRTARGIDLHDLESILPESSSFSSLRAIIDSLIHRNLLQLHQNRLSLTPSGLSLADEIIRELMFV